MLVSVALLLGLLAPGVHAPGAPPAVADSTGKTFLTVEEALALAFPGCKIERRTEYLDEREGKRVEELAHVLGPRIHEHRFGGLDRALPVRLDLFGGLKRTSDWLKFWCYPYMAAITEEDEYWYSKCLMAEMIRSGTTCFVGERNQVTIDVSPDMLRKQLTIVASWTFSQMGQAECAQFIVDRKIDVEKLFTHRWNLDQAEEAYKLFDTQTTGKGVFLM